ncbi:EAL domain-containing protein [Vibrio cyclitrophicus]|uniref:EAL domain-containing protein n=1 Tax=Vibrio cyclitrophicus TaxID=47951 RepID=UPI0021C31E23|nr:EAL domain-containing protein [Vibrio cyclitrophicus]
MPDRTALSNVFTQTLEQAVDGVVVIDSKNNIMLFNSAAEKLWGYNKDEVLGENVKILVPDDIKPHHDNLVNANRETGINKIVGTSRDIEIVGKNGSKKWGAFSISKVEVDGSILYTAFIKDVTDLVLQRKRMEMLSLVTDKSDNAIFVTNENWELIYINKGFTKLLGYKEHNILGQTPTQVIAPNFSSESISSIRKSLFSGNALKLEELITTQDNRELWCSIMSNPVFDQSGKLTNVVGILSEITETKLHEVLHAQVLNAIASDKALEVIMEIACHEVVKMSSDIIPIILKIDDENKLQPLASLNLPTEIKSKLENLKISDNNGSAATSAFINEAVFMEDILSSPLLNNQKTTLPPLGIKSCWSLPIRGQKSEVIGVISFYSKKRTKPTKIEHTLGNVLAPLCGLAIEREVHRQNIRQLAYYDSLTQLPNRSLLHAEAEHALREAESNATTLAVLFLDLDRFKQINDSFGHPEGDRFLKAIASRIQNKCTNGDICGRLSGDEFVIVVKNKAPECLNNFIEELKLSISSTYETELFKITPSASIGISVYPNDGHDIGTLIHRADMAMYQAKTAGKGRFSFFSHELNQLAQERQELEIELQKAIDENQLELVYQPQINMGSGTLYGVEALTRWVHPKFGAVTPNKFIPLAEECGLIGDLSRWALRTACKQMSIWRSKEIDIPSVSVNLSPINFHNLDLCDLILSELNTYNLKTTDLTLELTEGIFLDTNPNTMKTLHDIHDQGIGLSIDDFGTGYSSLSYLNKIPLKELKLDKSFVTEIEASGTSRALSQAVIQIGESLNLDVVAEGVESQGQYKVLKEQGYHVAQGFLFAKPLNPIEIEVWLKNISAHVFKHKN